jgi:hypothetical protein
LKIINKNDRTVYDSSKRIYTYAKDDTFDQCFRSIKIASEEIKKFAITSIRGKGIPVWLRVGNLTDVVSDDDKSK